MNRSVLLERPSAFIDAKKRWVINRLPAVVLDNLHEFKLFFKFSMVGVTGATVDFGSLTILHEVLDFPLLPSVAAAFSLAVINNYVWNVLWTYNHHDHSNQHHVKLSKFFVVSLVGLLINLSIVHVMTNVIGIFWLFSKLTATLIVLVWN
ncbi:MAG: hypothetical protein C4294_17650, partial [Nitrospiraceae bacterium]